MTADDVIEAAAHLEGDGARGPAAECHVVLLACVVWFVW